MSNLDNDTQWDHDPFHCYECGDSNRSVDWCFSCMPKHFEEKFQSQGNPEIDKIIRETQKEAKSYQMAWEWIPYSQFEDIQKIGEGGFGTVYKAKRSVGKIILWDLKKNDWKRDVPTIYALKSVKSESFDSFIHELQAFKESNLEAPFWSLACHGVTQNPDTGEYMLVLDFASQGDLRNYIRQRFEDITWSKRLDILFDIASSLESLHGYGLVHRDFHTGNVLFLAEHIRISDLGLAKNIRNPSATDQKDGAFGIVPYVAPEVLCGQSYTPAADVYGFAMMMWEITSGKPPFGNDSHDTALILKICKGVRPEIVDGTPSCYAELMQQCWSHDPSLRPSATEIAKRILDWRCRNNEIKQQFQMAEEERQKYVDTYNETEAAKIHPMAIYSSRLLETITFDQDPMFSYEIKSSELMQMEYSDLI